MFASFAGDGSQSDNEEVNDEKNYVESHEKEKTDQSQQTTPTTPPVVDAGKFKYTFLCSVCD